MIVRLVLRTATGGLVLVFLLAGLGVAAGQSGAVVAGISAVTAIATALTGVVLAFLRRRR